MTGFATGTAATGFGAATGGKLVGTGAAGRGDAATAGCCTGTCRGGWATGALWRMGVAGAEVNGEDGAGAMGTTGAGCRARKAFRFISTLGRSGTSWRACAGNEKASAQALHNRSER